MLATLCLPAASFAKTEKEAINLDILEESGQLVRLLSPAELSRYLRASELLEEGEDNIRSGRFLVERRPSALNPNEDLKAAHERGEALVEKGGRQIREAQREMVALLEGARERENAVPEVTGELLQGAVPTDNDFAGALRLAAVPVLQECWDRGYDRIFFDRVRESSPEDSANAPAPLLQLAYEVLTDLDGTRFSINMPVDLELVSPGDPPGAARFNFANQGTYKRDQIAYLAVELLSAGADADAGDLLVVRAIDLQSLQLIAQTMRRLQPEAAGAAQEDDAESQPELIQLDDTTAMIGQLATLPDPYVFRVETQDLDAESSARVTAWLTQILVENTDLSVVPTAFLERQFAGDLALNFQPRTNARLLVSGSGPEFNLSARADAVERTLPVGQLGPLTAATSD